MAIDPNIALGIKPIEQPNMLGQMAQVMAMRQAQQEYENEGGLRNALTKGMPEDPSSLLKYGKSGRAVYESALKGKKEQLESSQKRIDMMGGLAGFVRERPTPENFESSLTQAVSYGLMTEAQKQADLAKYGGSPESIKAYADQKFQGALTAKDRTANETRIQAANIGAAPGHRQATVAEQKFAIEKSQQAEIDALFGKPPSAAPAAAPMIGGGGGGVPNALPAAVGATPAAPASSNMLLPGAQAPAAAAAPPVVAQAPAAAAPTGDLYDQIKALDAKIAPLVNTGNPRASAIVQQLIAQRNALMQSAKQQYGGTLVDMEVTNPDTGERTIVKGREDQYGRLVPVELAPAPITVNAGGNNKTSISPTVARPAPSAAVVKERQATEKLPEAIAMNNEAIRKINDMIGGIDAKGKPLEGAAGKPHPGLSKATGLGGGVMRFFSGTEGKNFEIRHKEVLSQAFLDAFEALKGGGSITEKEGEKATAARTRMDLAQSKDEYIEAAREYQGVLKRGVENARARMQRSGTSPTAGAQADPLGIR